jgi:hypothetical protein
VLLARLRGALPEEFRGEYLVEVNERLRFLKYEEGMFFKVGGWLTRTSTAWSHGMA